MKAKRKLFIPVVMLLLAVMAVTSTTFAWITKNSTVNANILNAGVTKGEEMLYIVRSDVSNPATATWGLTASYDFDGTTKELQDLHMDLAARKLQVRNAVAGVYAPATSYVEVSYTLWCSGEGFKINFAGYDAAVNKVTSTSESGKKFNNADYNYAKTFATGGVNVADTNAAKIVEFYTATSLTAAGFADAAAYAAAGYEVLDGRYFNMGTSGAYLASAANSARVLFTVNARASDAAVAASSTYHMWDPNAGQGYNALDSGSPIYPFDVQDMYGKAQTGSIIAPRALADPYASAALSTANINVIPRTGSVDYTLGFFHNNTTGTEASASTDTKTTREGQVYYRADITALIWLEGDDPDCFNSILNGVLGANFVFTSSSPI